MEPQHKMDDTMLPLPPACNEYGQPVGRPLEAFSPPAPVQSARLTQTLKGNYCTLTPLATDDAADLFAAFDQASETLWTYLPYGPFDSIDAYKSWIEQLNQSNSGTFAYCIRTKDKNQAMGVASYLRVQPDCASLEIGHLSFSPLLQQTVAATEAIFMMIDAAFTLGYRRVEWKCDDLNIPSIAAAGRFGFKYEGTFRQALVVKGRNRDTAWFSIIDNEWEGLRAIFETWLAKSNFNKRGKQILRLAELTQRFRNQLDASA